jgi:hypothetical protein
MPRISGGPPTARSTTEKEWYREQDVTCDKCQRPAEVRYGRRNLCHVCLNPSPSPEYMAMEVVRCCVPKSSAGFWDEE